MTTIAWDGKTLAADTQSGLFKSQVNKLYRLSNDDLLGMSGHLSFGHAAISWLNKVGEKPIPTTDTRFHAILIKAESGELYTLEDNLIPFRYFNKFFAVGSGRDFAVAAMHLGCSAVEAVAIAHIYDSDTGPNIETLSYVPQESVK